MQHEFRGVSLMRRSPSRRIKEVSPCAKKSGQHPDGKPETCREQAPEYPLRTGRGMARMRRVTRSTRYPSPKCRTAAARNRHGGNPPCKEPGSKRQAAQNTRKGTCAERAGKKDKKLPLDGPKEHKTENGRRRCRRATRTPCGAKTSGARNY